jgi:hypothetical protein
MSEQHKAGWAALGLMISCFSLSPFVSLSWITAQQQTFAQSVSHFKANGPCPKAYSLSIGPKGEHSCESVLPFNPSTLHGENATVPQKAPQNGFHTMPSNP